LQAPVELTKIILKGKTLDDNNKTLGEYGVADNDGLIVFVTKVITT
jgi:hypothetical protein